MPALLPLSRAAPALCFHAKRRGRSVPPPPSLAIFEMGEKTKFLQHLNMVKI